MSVLIKDMEMPETCDDCPFHVYYSHNEYVCKATPLFYPMNLANSKGIRKDWCPLSDAPDINVGTNKRTETQRKNVWHNTYNDGFPAEGYQVLVTDGKYFWLDESVANDVGLMWEGDGSTCWERTEWAYTKDLYVG